MTITQCTLVSLLKFHDILLRAQVVTSACCAIDMASITSILFPSPLRTCSSYHFLSSSSSSSSSSGATSPNLRPLTTLGSTPKPSLTINSPAERGLGSESGLRWLCLIRRRHLPPPWQSLGGSYGFYKRLSIFN